MKLSAWMLAFAAVALAQVPHQHHPPLSADEWARVLDDPSRDAWQKPHAVVMALDLETQQIRSLTSERAPAISLVASHPMHTRSTPLILMRSCWQ